MRLIDADKIKLPQGFFEKVDNVPKFYEWLDNQSTVDAVEVVRCKDCAFRFTACPMVVRVGSFIQFFTEDGDYCSYGERRENDGSD